MPTLEEPNQRVTELTAELAAERAAHELEKRERARNWNERNEARSERDTALARVKELERNESNLLMQAHDARVAKKAAETALASARTVISLFAPASAVARDWLTSHPAPVAAPSCGRAWCTPDNRCADCTPQCTVCGRWSGHCGCVVPAPVAAPCAGCAALVVAETALASAQEDVSRFVDAAVVTGEQIGALRAAIGAAVVELERAKQLVGVRRALALLCAAQKAGG